MTTDELKKLVKDRDRILADIADFDGDRRGHYAALQRVDDQLEEMALDLAREVIALREAANDAAHALAWASGTDALAEWKAEAKRNIRDSVLHECLDIAESLGRRSAEATYASDEGRLQNAAKCYAAGEIATAIEARIAAAIRQETNDD
jgi:hypothetical protein